LERKKIFVLWKLAKQQKMAKSQFTCCLSSDLKCLLYPPSKEFQVKTPAVWNEKMFSKNIWPKTSWMEYDVAHVFNKTEETWCKLPWCVFVRFTGFIKLTKFILIRIA
jgi:hypothetical protein